MQSRAPAARSTISFAKNFKQLTLRINSETALIRITVRVRVITHNVDANGLAGYMVSGCWRRRQMAQSLPHDTILIEKTKCKSPANAGDSFNSDSDQRPVMDMRCAGGEDGSRPRLHGFAGRFCLFKINHLG